MRPWLLPLFLLFSCAVEEDVEILAPEGHFVTTGEKEEGDCLGFPPTTKKVYIDISYDSYLRRAGTYRINFENKPWIDAFGCKWLLQTFIYTDPPDYSAIWFYHIDCGTGYRPCGVVYVGRFRKEEKQ